MSRSRTCAAGLLIVAAAATALTWHLKNRRATDLQESALWTREIASLRREQQHLAERATAVRLSTDRIARAVSRNKVRPSKRFPSWLSAIRTDPKLQARRLITLRAELGMEYGPLFRRLGLTPTQIEAFEDNWVHRDAAQIDLSAVVFAQKLSSSDPSVQELQKQNATAYFTAQQQLLGSDGFNQLQTYSAQLFGRMLVADTAGAAAVAGISFSPDQVQKLGDIVAPALVAAPAAGDTDWGAIDAHASGILSPEQLQFFKSAEATGPFGYGGRYQDTLNNLITKGDQIDVAAAAH